MRRIAPLLALAMALVVVATPVFGAAVTVLPVTDGAGGPDGAAATAGTAGAADAVPTTNNSSVEVGTGSQLSTVLATTEDDIDTAVSTSAFDAAFEAANETERAALLAERGVALQAAARTITTEYREATRALRNGTLNRTAYAQRLATLNARARNVLSSIDHVLTLASNVSAVELQAEGFDRRALRTADAELDAVTGAAPAALLRRFTARSDANVSIETNGAVSVEVTSEGGERTVEVTRGGDTNRSLTLTETEALANARSALTRSGNWTLVEARVRGNSGVYEFEFEFSARNATGEAEVSVDGSSGTVVRLEEEIEPSGDADPDGRDDETEPADPDRPREGGTLTLLVASGDPAPNATITLQARRNGSPVANATVYVDDERVGTTDSDGTVQVTLTGEKTTVTVESGEAEAEREFEFDTGDERSRVLRDLTVSASLGDGTASVSVTYRGDAVHGAQVFADGDRVGTTGGDGSVTFPLASDTEELEVTIRKGQLELERTFRVENGSLTRPADEQNGTDDEREGRKDESETSGNLTLAVVSGDPARNATITLEARLDGEAAPGVTIRVDGERVGTTGGDGTIQVTLTGEKTRIEAEKGNADAERRFEFEDDEDNGTGSESESESESE